MATDVIYSRIGPELESAPVPGGILYRTTTTDTQVSPSGQILSQQITVTITFVPSGA